ncbi:MAG: DHA2 family efflux MFS transporter permease subunit [Methylobacter sp.]|nr:DHA2 family efflux MFS transporter permease subunit [Methylobacter sp.]MDP2100039.1 DHA2 family efflux MFS transporter permease subunit [Methylobacter sp.]MDP2427582.1 DHA2 family efflux MFS transporter permease subunit [Methylobacter sp.]MDP3055285.1 DHA2 family efflux MFS transporter permease subunit [Methylobacter sp.]MDP3364047.1 DHA2 family efflux MFS transporter permease subunit [Methylobacter sp.]
MAVTDKNARTAWATLTHDSLNAHSSKRTLSGVQFFFLNFGLLMGNILVLFNTGAFASVSLHATGDLGVSPSHAGWMQTYYFISLALALPVSAWLAAAVGEVRLYWTAMIVMALASLLCAVTSDLFWFLSGRALQGFFGGLTIPLSQTLLIREYPESSKSFAVSLWSIAALSPFTLGPAAGGWIADHLGWRWLFYLNGPLPLLAAALVWALLFDRQLPQRKMPFDGVGFLLLAAALVCLQTALNQGQDADWYNSVQLVVMTLVGLLMLAYFIIWELAERSPLLDLRLFARRNFAIGSIMLSVSFMLMYGLLSVLLVRLQVVSGYTSFLAGSVLLPLVFLAKPMASVMHRIVHRFDARLLVSLNMLLFAVYCDWISRYDFFGRGGWFSQPLWAQVLEGFCLGGLFVPLTTLFLFDLTPRRQTQAVELGGMLRVLGGSIASPLLGLCWERRTAFHQSRLIESFSLHDGSDLETIASLNAAGLHDQLAVAKLAAVAGQHAAILGLDDTFRLAAWLFVGLAATVWLAHPVGPKPAVLPKDDSRQAALEDLMEEP